MHPLIKIVLAFSILIIFTSEAYPSCIPQDESYKKHVLKAREFVKNGKSEKAVEEYKEHLLCWNDNKVYLELGEFYESLNKDYLAGLAYKKAGEIDKFNAVEQKNITNLNGVEVFNFEYLSKQRSERNLKHSKTRKRIANSLFFIGPIIATAGIGLFIHDKAGGTNSLAAQYSLMLGGLSILNLGISLNLSSINYYNKSEAFLGISNKYGGDGGTTPDEFYKFSGTESQTNKISAKAFRKHGATLMLMSIPLFAVAIYGFSDSYNYHKQEYSGESCGDDSCDSDIGLVTLFTHIGQIFTFTPAILSFIGGSVLLYKGYQWEKLNTEPSLLTLNSVTPIINPVSKTYGLALGFSF